MSISLVTGPPGFGKTYYVMRQVDAALARGEFVVMNVEPTWDWVERSLRRDPKYALYGKARKARLQAERRRRLVVVEAIGELLALRDRGCGACKACKHGAECEREDRWLVVLDELQLWLDARGWKDDAGTRKPILAWFTMHRKLGARVLVATQHELNIDSYIRRCFEVHIRMKALHKLKVAGVRVFPCRVFIAFHYFNDTTKMLIKRETFGLNKRIAGLYRTMAVSATADVPTKLIYLGDKPWTPPATPRPNLSDLDDAAADAGPCTAMRPGGRRRRPANTGSGGSALRSSATPRIERFEHEPASAAGERAATGRGTAGRIFARLTGDGLPRGLDDARATAASGAAAERDSTSTIATTGDWAGNAAATSKPSVGPATTASMPSGESASTSVESA